MALKIRDPEAERLADVIAALTGESKTQAVTTALRERLAQLQRARAAGRRTLAELNEIALHCASLPILDHRSADEVLGYDEDGLSR